MQLDEWPQELIDYLHKVNYQWPKWDDLEIPEASESDPMPMVTRPYADGRRGSPDPMPTRYDTDTDTIQYDTIHSAPAADADASVRESPGPSEQKRKTQSAEVVKVSADDGELYHRIKETFEREQPGHRFTDYPKEGKSIKGLIKKARARDPTSPTDLAMGMVEAFRQAREADAFFGKQPFLPSALNASGIYDRVMEWARQQSEMAWWSEQQQSFDEVEF